MNENLNFSLGQSLLIEQSDECFSGEFHFMNKTRTRIELRNVRDYNTNQQLQGIQIFYKPDIRSITPLKGPHKVDTNSSSRNLEQTSLNNSSGSSNKATDTEEQTASNITQGELDLINQAVFDRYYFTQTDRNYYDAITEIQGQSLVTLSIEYEYKAEMSLISLITIGTMSNDQIYIFDLISMGGKIPSGLQEILSAECPRKIIHDSSVPTHILNLTQNIQLNSIFDTLIKHDFFTLINYLADIFAFLYVKQAIYRKKSFITEDRAKNIVTVAHVALGNEKKTISLENCIIKHFKLPTIFFNIKETDFLTRPLTDELKEKAAKKVAYLPKLYTYLLHERMLKSFYESCDKYSKVYVTRRDEFDTTYDIFSNRNPAHKNIEQFEFLDCNVNIEALNL